MQVLKVRVVSPKLKAGGLRSAMLSPINPAARTKIRAVQSLYVLKTPKIQLFWKLDRLHFNKFTTLEVLIYGNLKSSGATIEVLM
jgi:hypothetical protein